MTTSTFDPAEFAETHGVPVTDLERYPLDSCARKRRNGDTDNPYRGCSAWLLPDTPMSLTTAALDLRGSQNNDDADGSAMHNLCAGIAQCVAGHDIPAFAQFYGNPAAVEAAPTELVMFLFTLIMSGEVPEERPNGSIGGQRGSSTRTSTGRTTRA